MHRLSNATSEICHAGLAVCSPNSDETQKRFFGMQMIADGRSTSDIAKALGVDPRTVRRWRHRDTPNRTCRALLVDQGSFTSEEISELIQALSRAPAQAGFAHTYSWTRRLVRRLFRAMFPQAAEARISPQLVRRWLKRHGFVWRRSSWVPADFARHAKAK